jgi:hypothetical protein
MKGEGDMNELDLLEKIRQSAQADEIPENSVRKR